MDVYSDFKRTIYNQKVAKGIIEREETPEAVTYFAEVCDGLTDDAYWFFLSTIWVSYTGFSDLNLWKKLFSSTRRKQKQCIMKPSETKAFEHLPYFITIYRAHRVGEKDWIAYTLNIDTAIRFASERNVNQITEYKVKKRDVLALFLRRGEDEIIILDKGKVEFVRDIELVISEANS